MTPPSDAEFRLLQEKLQGRGQNFVPLLRCPITGAAIFRQDENTLVSDADTSLTYDGSHNIYRLIPSNERESFAAATTQHAQIFMSKGWTPADTDAFRRLPQTQLPTWSKAYWQNRAHAVAEMWRILEDIRRREDRLPIGSMGTAADFTDGMGWLGYGLDVSGYNTLVLSEHNGPYGLDVFPASRYVRVQGSLTTPPLANDSFDLVTFSFSLENLAQPVEALRNACELLKNRGIIMILSANGINVDESVQTLRGCKLDVQTKRVGAMGGSVGRAIKGIINRTPNIPPIIIARKI